MTGGNQFISIHPNELKFECQTTSPKKYFVRPNTGVIQPWDSCFITVTLQAQREYPPDMQCKDKFLLQSTIVPPHTDVDELPADTFNKEGDKVIQDCKLRVVYATSSSQQTSDVDQKNSSRSVDTNSIQAVQRVKEERDAAVRQTHQLQHELELLRRRRNRNSDQDFSLTFAAFVGLIGIMVGFILNLTFSVPSTE
ncbi:hypothetical protein AQUCO_05300041v1 [Aquilegia coerulea]|uniref:MSP domain-containing protein n=1 Tax=Aquilegia coerulea TaxID=218851 RepID=A0A2G5CI16_AQUCA|nr:hypothetical protein AQUCO_05300041v1 [Aquilegia coerulea]